MLQASVKKKLFIITVIIIIIVVAIPCSFAVDHPLNQIVASCFVTK